MDILLKYNKDLEVYDINITDDGDIETSDTYDTPIIMSLFTDERATSVDVNNVIFRRGWFGSLINNKDYQDLPYGSRLWLLAGRITQKTKNLAENFSYIALEWLKKFESVRDINIATSLSRESVIIEIEFVLENGLVNSYKFDGWRLTNV